MALGMARIESDVQYVCVFLILFSQPVLKAAFLFLHSDFALMICVWKVRLGKVIITNCCNTQLMYMVFV